jgi:hypothetical protein
VFTQDVSNRALPFRKLIQIYSEDMYSVLNCHNAAKYTDFYLGYLRFNVTSIGNAECFKKSFTMVFQMLLCASVMKIFTLKGIQTVHCSTPLECHCKAFLKHSVFQRGVNV